MNRMNLQAPAALDEVMMDRDRALEPTGPLIPLIIGCALFMQTLDSMIIANALPTMARTLHEDPVTLNLAITVYLLAAAVFLPISGWVADRFGAKTVFRVAIGVFTISSLACGLSQNLPELVAARMIQGIGGAMMAPVGRLVLLRSVPKSDLVRAMSYLTLPAMLGPVLGPPIGGAIVTYASWRWIFLLNIPLGVLGIALVSVFVPNIREDNVPPLDWKGFILSGFGLAGLVYGFENLGHDIMPFSVVAGLLIGGIVCLVAYAWHAKRTPHPLLDLSLLKLQTFATSVLGGGFLRIGIAATPFLLALLFQIGFGMSAFAAGMMTFASGSGSLIMKIAARPIINRFGFKSVLVVNTWVSAIAFMTYALFKADTPRLWIVATLVIGSFFRSLQFTALAAIGYAEIDNEQMSRASSFASMLQQLSQSVGIGLVAMILVGIRWLHHANTIGPAEVSPVFVIIGLISLGGLFYFMPLSKDAGAEMSGHGRHSHLLAGAGDEDEQA